MEVDSGLPLLNPLWRTYSCGALGGASTDPLLHLSGCLGSASCGNASCHSGAAPILIEVRLVTLRFPVPAEVHPPLFQTPSNALRPPHRPPTLRRNTHSLAPAGSSRSFRDDRRAGAARGERFRRKFARSPRQRNCHVHGDRQGRRCDSG